jgi:hypothetical protein
LTANRRADLSHGINVAYVHGCVCSQCWSTNASGWQKPQLAHATRSVIVIADLDHPGIQYIARLWCVGELSLVELCLTARDLIDLSCSKYSGSRCRRREGKKRNSIKSSKLIGLLAKVA